MIRCRSAAEYPRTRWRQSCGNTGRDCLPRRNRRAFVRATARHPWLGFGWCGVDLFFVLSGFLITGILIDTKETAHAFRNFYARRILRIFPLYYLTLAVYFHVLPAAARLLSGFHRFQRTEELWYWLYVCNWSPSIGTAHALLTHLWSLSIEEQFYLFWPLLVFTLSRRSVGRLCAAVIVLTPCLRLGYLLTVVGGGSLLYRITLFRIDTLAFGALCALLVRDPGRLRLAMQARPILLAAAGIGLAASIAIGGTSSYLPPMNVIGFTSLALGDRGRCGPSRGPAIRPLTFHWQIQLCHVHLPRADCGAPAAGIRSCANPQPARLRHAARGGNRCRGSPLVRRRIYFLAAVREPLPATEIALRVPWEAYTGRLGPLVLPGARRH